MWSSKHVFMLAVAVGIWSGVVPYTEIELLFKPSLINCSPTLPPWIRYNQNSEATEVFLDTEKRLVQECFESTVELTIFSLNGSYSLPQTCEKLIFCNSTDCLVIPPIALQLIYTLPHSCVPHIRPNPFNDFFVINSEFNSSFKHLSSHEYYLLMESISTPAKSFPLYPKINAQELPFSRTENSNCDSKLADSRGAWLVEGLGNLPTSCSSMTFCNKEECFIVPKTSLAYSFLINRSQFLRYWGIDYPTSCHVESYRRLRPRNAVRIHEDLDESIDSKYSTDEFSKVQPYGILNFNLPGYRYCGPGTDIERMDDIGGPINDLDDLCREHDVNYLLGIDAHLADAKFLDGVWKINHPLLPLFITIFEAKRYFESTVGTEYTSSLYYVPKSFKSSLTYYVADKSAYDFDDLDFNNSTIGRNMDTKWKKIIHEIWRGYCFSGMMSGEGSATVDPENMGSASGQQAQSSSDTTSSQQQTPVSSGEGSSSESTIVVAEDMYPKPPTAMDPCRVIISEVAPGRNNEQSFVEFRKVCPPGKRNRAKDLKGYLVLFVEIGDPSTIHMVVSLNKQQLKEVEEVHIHKTINYYFVMGSSNMQSNMYFSQIPLMVNPCGNFRSVPSSEESTFAVILLHFPSKPIMDSHLGAFGLLMDRAGSCLKTPIGDTVKGYITEYLQDIMVYGAPCPTEICGDLLNWLRVLPQVMPVNNLFIPVPYVSDEQRTPLHTLNQCSPTTFPMQINDYHVSPATPGRRNICPITPSKDLFDLRGTPFQSTAQKLIVNTYQYFLRYTLQRTILTGGPITLTSNAISVSDTLVRQTLENWKTGSIVTPGKHKRPTPTVQCQFDDFYVDLIKRMIQDYYAKNRPPLVAELYKEFMSRVSTEDHPTKTNAENTEFKCGEKTFRKVLRKIGFKYGKINMRDVVLIRKDIVAWRGRYLCEIFENDKLENPLPVVYLDETWIDPHARTGKAWVPANMESYRERSLYSYKSSKVSRGPRVIVLNAGGNEGMIHGAMEVFAVQKKDVKGDYHDNVDGKFFLAWFGRLLDELDKTGPHLIVMDNAPYHGLTDLPKQSDRKGVIYEWLTKNLPTDEGPLLAEKTYRKFQLWDIVKQQKEKYSFYKIDKMAKERGHRIVRLPPYNCDLNPIEMVWKDVKHEVRKNNFDQNLNTVISTAKNVMLSFTKERWQKFVGHVKKLENQYWKDDGFYENFYDLQTHLVIPVGQDDEDDENDIPAMDHIPNVIHSSIHEIELLREMEDAVYDELYG